MVTIPGDVGDAIDLSMCPYTGFPQILNVFYISVISVVLVSTRI